MTNSKLTLDSRIMLISAFLILLTATSCNPSSDKKDTKEVVKTPSIALHDAVFLGNVDAVKKHILAGTDLNQKDAYGSSPLHVASLFGKTEVAIALIDGGANINMTNADGSTPLHTAAFFCRTEIVKKLLEKNADVTVKNSYGSTALESVSAPFEALKPIYDQFARDLGSFGLRLDYEHLETTLPVMAEMIKSNS